ncbi:hypothetical protein BDZ91DRAFT_792327 [Kalaharituber pfeilii]|nr:hypothetical protein BDZ91DRAFT_792327 [Kalaharituber pfeilii]
MSTPEDLFFNALHTVRDSTLHAANIFDSQLDSLATSLRGVLSSSTWLPESYRPRPPLPPPPPPPPPHSLPFYYASLLNPSYLYKSTSAWATRHKFLSATLFVSLTLGTCYTTHRLLLRRSKKRLKRRTARAPNGARTQVVIIAGYPHEAITGLLALDLEKRGFIVYIVVTTPEEERAVVAGVGQGRADIRPLMLDVADPVAHIERFASYLLSPQTAFQGATASHYLSLVGLVIVPALSSYQVAPIEVLCGDMWADTMNINLLQPIVITRCFLRVLALFKARVVVLQSVIVPSLAPPFCALETVVGRAVEGWVGVLEREVSPFGVGVSLIKVGNVEGLSGGNGNQHFPTTASASSSASSSRMRTPSPSSIPPGARADVLSWPAPLRASYARQFIASLSSSSSPAAAASVRGAPLRDLHIAVFDALSGGGSGPKTKRPAKHVYSVGTGSRVYEVLAGWLPRSAVGWLLGVPRFGSVNVQQHRRARGEIRNAGDPEPDSGSGGEGGVGSGGGAAVAGVFVDSGFGK